MNVLLFHLDGSLPNYALMMIYAHHTGLLDKTLEQENRAMMAELK